MQSTSAAASTAAKCPMEILEMIFIHLSYKSIMAVRAVCKSWKSATESSPAVRKLRFVEADYEAERSFLYTRIAMAPFSKTFHFDSSSDLGDPAVQYDKASILRVHPLLVAEVKRRRKAEMMVELSFSSLKSLLSLPKKAEWKQVFLTQPPCTKICLMLYQRGPTERRGRPLIKVRDKDGVRMGLVVEKLRELVYPKTKAGKARKVARFSVERFSGVRGYISDAVEAGSQIVREAEMYGGGI